MEILQHQYDLVKERRQTLFNYCESLTPNHFTKDHENFGGRSIRYLFVHVANTYFFWLTHFPKRRAVPFVKPEEYLSTTTVHDLFQTVDEVVISFLQETSARMTQPVSGRIESKNLEVSITPLQLFTHVITHEYHHKGQMLSMSRQMGYVPIDTDIIRFD